MHLDPERESVSGVGARATKLVVGACLGYILSLMVFPAPKRLDRRYLVDVKSELRNLATAQEAFFADSGRYFSGTASNVDGQGDSLPGFTPGPGVTITTLASGSGDAASFHAIASHAVLEGVTCGMSIGEPPPAPAIHEGEPMCARTGLDFSDVTACLIRFRGRDCSGDGLVPRF